MVTNIPKRRASCYLDATVLLIEKHFICSLRTPVTFLNSVVKNLGITWLFWVFIFFSPFIAHNCDITIVKYKAFVGTLSLGNFGNFSLFRESHAGTRNPRYHSCILARRTHHLVVFINTSACQAFRL